MPTDSYFDPARQLAKCMMINLLGLIQMHKNSTNCFQNCISVLQTRKNKRINADRSESKSGNVSVCSIYESKSKIVPKMNHNSRVCSTYKSKPKSVH